MAAVIGWRGGNWVWYIGSEHEKLTHNQIVIAKSIRVALSSEILCDGTILQVDIPVDHELSSARVEPQDVVE